MTDLDRQAIRELLNQPRLTAYGIPARSFTADEVEALLDALEAAERYGEEMRLAAIEQREAKRNAHDRIETYRHLLEAAERERDARTVERDTWRERWVSEYCRRYDEGDVPYSATVEIRDGRVESIGYMEPADVRQCDHPLDAVQWNPWNRVVQCHRCGQVMARPGEHDAPLLAAEPER